MEEAIQNLQQAFTKIIEVLEGRRDMIQADSTDLDNFVEEMSVQYPDTKEQFKIFRDNIISYKKDPSKFNGEVDKVKVVLATFQASLNNLTNSSASDDIRFGAKKRQPNPDFIKLIHQHFILPQQNIFTEVDDKIVVGTFTEDGYFKIANHTQLFSSLTTALSFAHGKPMTNGWDNWSVLSENGKTLSLKYYKDRLQ